MQFFSLYKRNFHVSGNMNAWFNMKPIIKKRLLLFIKSIHQKNLLNYVRNFQHEGNYLNNSIREKIPYKKTKF